MSLRFPNPHLSSGLNPVLLMTESDPSVRAQRRVSEYVGEEIINCSFNSNLRRGEEVVNTERSSLSRVQT